MVFAFSSQLVKEEGGFTQMSKDSKWLAIAKKLGFNEAKHVAGTLRQHYEKILYPYDVFMLAASADTEEVRGHCCDLEFRPMMLLHCQPIQVAMSVCLPRCVL